MDRERLLRPFAEPSGYTTAIFDGWEVVPGMVGETHVCTAILKGTEIHFFVVPEQRRKALLRGRMQAWIEPLFDRFGFLTTRVLQEHVGEMRFVERVGFKRTWADQHFQYYMLGRLPFARSDK